MLTGAGELVTCDMEKIKAFSPSVSTEECHWKVALLSSKRYSNPGTWWLEKGKHDIHLWEGQKKVIGSSQHGFVRRKSCIINLMAISDDCLSFPFIQHLCISGVLCPVFWLSNSWEKSIYWNGVSERPPSGLADQITWSTGKSLENRVCSAIKREG